MPLAEDDHVVQTLAPKGSEQSLRVRILPRTCEHYRAARAFEATRQARPACVILPSNRCENQLAGLAIKFWRPAAVNVQGGGTVTSR
jgi:hypothetical protein